ncbi:MAG: rSAM/selenodomain-associated transferase 2 [Gammaproteobacteria bacterium]|jgi:rSAM/selenodomain-associated transferase 2
MAPSCAAHSQERRPLSIVIPAFNESANIAGCLQSVAPLLARGASVLVCDGGSSDDTAHIARAHGAQVLVCAKGRARQMNAGALASNAHLLVFLHADTKLNKAVAERLWSLAVSKLPLWGRFDVRLSGRGAALRVIETCMNLRSRITSIATGDQVMFCTSDLFGSVNGFADIELMEDIELSAQLRRLLRPLCCVERVCTSSRKWREQGIVRTVVLMWRMRLAYAMGADPSHLAKIYATRPGARPADPPRQ